MSRKTVNFNHAKGNNRLLVILLACVMIVAIISYILYKKEFKEKKENNAVMFETGMSDKSKIKTDNFYLLNISKILIDKNEIEIPVYINNDNQQIKLSISNENVFIKKNSNPKLRAALLINSSTGYFIDIKVWSLVKHNNNIAIIIKSDVILAKIFCINKCSPNFEIPDKKIKDPKGSFKETMKNIKYWEII